MKTLLIMIVILIVLSIIKVYKYSNKNWNEYNPFNGPLWAYLGHIIGIVVILLGTLYLIVKYLP